jgi:hypothetical protein
MTAEFEPLAPAEETTAEVKCAKSVLRIITWFSVGMAVAALGIYVGTEWRSRYKFNRRTPYDFYSNAGECHPTEFGVGI